MGQAAFPHASSAGMCPVTHDLHLLPSCSLLACPVPSKEVHAGNSVSLSRLSMRISSGQVYTPATAGVLDGAAFSTFLTNQYAAKSTTGDSLRPYSMSRQMCSQS